jgi:hypothetical protein
LKFWLIEDIFQQECGCNKAGAERAIEQQVIIKKMVPKKCFY